MELPKLVTGPWTLKDLKEGKIGSPKHGLKVFSCFHCGGGSTMGYKLAGFDVLGGVEIDPEMMKLYKTNHNPKYSYLMGVQDFKNIPKKDIPEELFNLDVLDGSPPCSSFSMAGSREKAWGVEKKFREGQALQVLDDLFFHFIDVAKLLRPKIVVAENVKGLIAGNARGYVKEIFQEFKKAGYETQLFLFNASKMGVPQARERTFFIARRSDLNIEKINPFFNEKQITFKEAISGIDHVGKALTERAEIVWKKTTPGKSLTEGHENGNMFTWSKLSMNKVANTAISGPTQLCPDKPAHISDAAQRRIQSFPEDYNFLNTEVRYVCGMSVPPLMMQRVATEIAKKLL